jgi:hypothetical protein
MITDVWHAGRKVGTYDVPSKGGDLPSEFPLAEYSLNKDMVGTHDFHWIQVSRRHCEIDEDRLACTEEMAHMARAYDIPEYAEHTMFDDVRSNSRRVRFSWFVAAPSLEQYEIMFDYPSFEPV